MPNGRYLMDIAVASLRLRCMVDSGLIDPRDQIGMEIEPVLFDFLLRSGQFTDLRRRPHRLASGTYRMADCGQTQVQAVDPQQSQAIGPLVAVHVSRGMPSVPSRVGVAFFHRLVDCEVRWHLQSRTWCLNYP